MVVMKRFTEQEIKVYGELNELRNLLVQHGFSGMEFMHGVYRYRIALGLEVNNIPTITVYKKSLREYTKLDTLDTLEEFIDMLKTQVNPEVTGNVQ